MEAVTLRELSALPARPAPARAADADWDWIYDDPDLAPFRGAARSRGRPETPLTAFDPLP